MKSRRLIASRLKGRTAALIVDEPLWSVTQGVVSRYSPVPTVILVNRVTRACPASQFPASPTRTLS
jgi:hypothetical protein